MIVIDFRIFPGVEELLIRVLRKCLFTEVGKVFSLQRF